jgi:hypothetical protein
MASNGCWCVCWRIGSAYCKRPQTGQGGASQYRKRVPTWVARFDGDLAVGWCQITRATNYRGSTKPGCSSADDVCTSGRFCFYVRGLRAGHNDRADCSGSEAATRQGARGEVTLLIRTSLGAVQIFTRVRLQLSRAGFKTVARALHRPIMRHDLKT